MKVVVHDACALIDLLKPELVAVWTGAGIEIHTTQLALWEFADDAEVLHKSGALHIVEMSARELASLLEFKQSYGALSLEDCSVLRLACDLRVPLLTGDKDLKAVAERAGVQVHAMLWIFDQLVERQFMLPCQAVDALRNVCGDRSRFPRDEVEARLSLWS